MNNKELKEALTETWPIRPGQEGRAWTSLQGSLQADSSFFSTFLTWPRVVAGSFAVACIALLAFHLASPAVTPISAASQSPGIFATAFYSQPAKAQVVWLNGMDPATDGPTYMDPTTPVQINSPSTSAPVKSDQL